MINRLGQFTSAKFAVDIAVNPIKSMRRLGCDQASAHLFSLGLSRANSRQLMYVTGSEYVRPFFKQPEIFHTSNPPRRYPGGGAPARLRRGIIGNQGAEHKHYRSAISAQTGTDMLAEFSKDVATHVDGFLKTLPDNKPIDLAAMISDLVRHYAVVTMFKDENPETAISIGREITDWVDLAYHPKNLFLPLPIPGLPHARFRKSAAALEDRILHWAAARKGQNAKRDLLSMFVNGPDENGNPLAENRLAGHILTLYGASFTTSATSLIWALFLLNQHPKILADLCDEIDGSGINLLDNPTDILKLPILDRVFLESMRLFTPVPFQVRRVTQETNQFGTDLRPNDQVIIGAWATNRLKSVYENAEQFQPDRWVGKNSVSYDYLTFSAGPRRCVGVGIAMAILKITLAAILQQRRPNLISNQRIDTKVAVDLRAKQPMMAIFAPRSESPRKANITGTSLAMFDPSE